MKSAALLILAAVVVVAQATFPGYQELVEKKTDLKDASCWVSAVKEIFDNVRKYVAFCLDYGNEEGGPASIPWCFIENLPGVLGSFLYAVSDCIKGSA